MSNTSLLGSYGDNSGAGLMFRNRLINGDMRIDQRAAGTQSNAVTTQYHVDRWNYLGTTASKFTIQKSAVAPSGFTSSLLLTSSSAYAISLTSDWLALRHFIEGFNVADLAWGTANAQTVTLSFWTRSSLTGTFGGSILNDGSNRSYPFTYSISAANTWEYKTVVIPGDTSGTWTTDNSSGMRIVFSVGAGTSQKSAAGTWVGSAVWGGATGTVDLCATNGATLYITGVQLEAGPVATPFERRPFGTELALCQRYLPVMNTGGASGRVLASGQAVSTTTAIIVFPFSVTPRVTPTSIQGAVTASSYSVSNATGGNIIATSVNYVAATNLSAGIINVGVTSGLVAGNATYMFGDANIYWLGCEL